MKKGLHEEGLETNYTITVNVAANKIRISPTMVIFISFDVFFCPKNQIPVKVANTTDVWDNMNPVANPFILG